MEIDLQERMDPRLVPSRRGLYRRGIHLCAMSEELVLEVGGDDPSIPNLLLRLGHFLPRPLPDRAFVCYLEYCCDLVLDAKEFA